MADETREDAGYARVVVSGCAEDLKTMESMEELEALRKTVIDNRTLVIQLLYEDAVNRHAKSAIDLTVADSEVRVAKARVETLQVCIENERERLRREMTC